MRNDGHDDNDEPEEVVCPGKYFIKEKIGFEQVEGQQFVYWNSHQQIHRDDVFETLITGLRYLPSQELAWPLAVEPQDFVSETDLFQSVRDYISLYWDYADERAYDVFAAWVMATWLSEAWYSVPFFFFVGPWDSGKTRGLDIIKSIGYRGWEVPSTTTATIFRCDKAFSPTWLFDESEYLAQESKQEVIGLINSRYRRGQVVPRMKGDSYQVELFPVFGFTALAGTQDLLRTTKSRCIVFNMTPADREIPPILFPEDEDAVRLRNKLLMYRVTKLESIVTRSVTTLSCDDVTMVTQAGGKGRMIELYYPLVVVAPTQSIKDRILSYMKDEQVRIRAELTSDDDALIFRSMVDVKHETGADGLLITEVAGKVNENLPEKEKLTNRRIGYICRSLGFSTVHTRVGTAVMWNASKARRLSFRFGVDIPLSIVTIVTSSHETAVTEAVTIDGQFVTKGGSP